METLDRRILCDVAAPQIVGNVEYAVDRDGSAALLVDFTDTGGPGETHSISVDWSDGSTAPGFIDEPATGSGGAQTGTAYARHTYAVPGSYPVRVTLTDSTGLSTTTSFTAVFDPAAFPDPYEDDDGGIFITAPFGDSPTADFAPDSFTMTEAAPADSTAPRVQAVYVDSTAWSPAFRSYLTTQGLGDDGFAVGSGTAQTLALPWININQVKVRFTEAVNVVTEDLVLNGVAVQSYAFAGPVSRNPVTNTWTWTLSSNVAADRLLLHLRNTISDTSQNELDGDWEDLQAFPSGDGVNTDGNDNLFQYRINVLPGDVNRSGTVNVTDTADTRERLFRSTTNPGSGAQSYSHLNDVNGSGTIDAADLTEVRNRDGHVLTGVPSRPLLPLAPYNFNGQITFLHDEAGQTLLHTLVSHWAYDGTTQQGFQVERSILLLDVAGGVAGFANDLPSVPQHILLELSDLRA